MTNFTTQRSRSRPASYAEFPLAPRLEESGVMRAPHIHFEVSGKINRLVIVSLQPGIERGSRMAEWNIVLDEG